MKRTFGEIITDINNKTRTSMLICCALFIAGFILFATRHTVGWLFLCVGFALAYSLFNKQRSMKRELSRIRDFDKFTGDFASDECIRMELLGLAICGDYAVLTLPSLKIYPMCDMEKFEVGLQGDVRKVLFLTDRNGKRFKVAETQKGDALQSEFDRAYQAVREYFNNRQNV